MFSLTISFGPAATMWTLMWRTKEHAEKAFSGVRENLLNKNGFYVKDDFGQEAVIDKAADVHGLMLEDMELSKLAHIERALHQARLQAQGQQAAEADQVLRTQRSRSGPAVLTPGMNGFPR